MPVMATPTANDAAGEPAEALVGINRRAAGFRIERAPEWRKRAPLPRHDAGDQERQRREVRRRCRRSCRRARRCRRRPSRRARRRRGAADRGRVSVQGVWGWSMSTGGWQPGFLVSHVELEQHHVAVRDDVLLAFVARLAGVLGRLLAAEADEVVVGDGLGADEALLEIGVDGAGRLRRSRAARGRSRRELPSARR